MLKNRFLLAIAAFVFSTTIKAQTIVIDDARLVPAAGLSYGAGSSVAIPINIGNSCFDKTNVFTWKLLKAGIPVIGVSGTVNVFYATFINATLPATLTPANDYAFQVTASTTGSNVAISATFSVVANPSGITVKAEPVDKNLILLDQYYFGICDGNSIDNMLLHDSSTIGGIDSIEMIDNYRTNAFTIQKFVPNASGNFDLLFHKTKVGGALSLYSVDAYYTAFAKTINGNIVSTKGYHIINNTWNVDIGAAKNSGNFCKIDTVSINVELDYTQTKHLQQNFPGALVVINWNDVSLDELYTQCSIIAANGVLKHLYSKTACKNTNGVNPAYEVTSRIKNPFNILNGPGITGTCPSLTRAKAFAQLFSPPKAIITMDSIVCAYVPFDTLKLSSRASDLGQAAANTGLNGLPTSCAELANFTWLVDNVPFYHSKNGWVESYKDTSYPFSTKTPGMHTVQLQLSNKYGNFAPCKDDTTIRTVCVDTAHIMPIYSMNVLSQPSSITYFNNNDTLIGCAPQIKLVNTTRRTFCLDSTKFKYIWQVYKILPTSTIVAPSSDYNWVGTANQDSMSPTLSINKTGKYLVSLRVKGVCDTTIAITKYIEANGDAGVSFRQGTTVLDSVFNCEYPTPLVINYNPDTSVNHINMHLYPTAIGVYDTVQYDYQASAIGSLSYLWTISPAGGWAFINGTSNTSKYPTIQFNAPGIYTVTDTFKNNCATKYATQKVVVGQQLVAFGYGNVDTICHATTSYTVHGFSLGATTTGVKIHWETNPPNMGNFQPQDGDDTTPNIFTPVFTPSANTYLNTCGGGGGGVNFSMIVTSKLNKGCSTAEPSGRFFIRECIKSLDTIKNVCNGSPINYKHSQSGGATFDWAVDIASLNGAKVDGTQSGTNVSLITNTVSITGPVSTLKIKITPHLGTCDGDPYFLIIVVRPIPAKPNINIVYPKSVPPTICSGDTIHVELSGNDVSDRFTWASHDSLRKITGYSSLANMPSPIVDTLRNDLLPLKVDVATYIVNTVSQYGCVGLTDSFKIIVNPGPPLAHISNKPLTNYLSLCDSSCITFTANDASAIGIGTWTVSQGSPLPTTTNVNSPIAQFCGLGRNQYHQFKWSIDPLVSGSCPGSSDSVLIFNFDSLSTPNAGNDTVVCNIGNGVILPLNGSINRPIPAGGYEDYVWSQYSNGGTAVYSTSTTNTAATHSFTSTGVDTLLFTVKNGICPAKTDTAIFRLYVSPVRGSITLSPNMPQSHYCQGSNVTLTSNHDATKNDVLRWYYYTLTPFTGIYTPIPASGSNPFTINNVQESIGVYANYKSKGWDFGCLDSITSYDIRIYVDSPSMAGKIIAKDTILCVSGYVATLKDSAYRGTSIHWQVSTTGATGTYIDTALGNSYSPQVFVTSWFRTVVQSGNCPADISAPVQIYIPTPANNAKAGNDTAVCGDSTFKLIGNIPPAGTGYWKMITGPINGGGTGFTFNASNNYQTTQNPVVANIKLYGTYQFTWSIENQGCSGTADTITIINTPPIAPDIIYANKDTVCRGTYVNFTAKPTIGGSGVYTYTWEKSVNGGTWTYISPNANGYLFLADSTTKFRRWVKSDSCNVVSNAIEIVVHQPILNNVITPTVTPVCTNTLASTIGGSNPTGGNGTNYTYTWYYGTNLDTLANLLMNANNTTVSYTPILILTDTMNFRRIVVSGKCTDTSKYATITVNPDAKATFTVTSTDTIRCAPFALPIYAAPLSLTTTYTWYVDSAGIRIPLGTGAGFPGYKYTKSLDSVKVVLVATSNQGCKSDSTFKWYYTSATPIAGFTVSVDSGCANNTGLNTTTFNFTNTTQTPSLFGYIFDYGDNNKQSLTISPYNPPTHTYAPSSTGLDTTYNVCISAISPNCGANQSCKSIKIRTKPNVLFTATPTYQCSDSLILFTNATIGSNLTYNWIFGDAGNTTGSNSATTVSHGFHVTGLTTFVPKLIAGNECASDSFATPVVVASHTVTLNASVSGGNLFRCNPGAYTFVSNSSGANSYYWDFGDKVQSLATSNGKDSTTHTYLKPGTYTVKLYGTTPCNFDSTSFTVIVYGTPKVDFTINPTTTVCIGDTVTFTNKTDTATSYNWSFGSGALNPTNVYTAAGVYPVKLVANRIHTLPLPFTNMTCTDSSSIQTVTVRDTMPALFTMIKSSTCLPIDVTFTDITTITTQPISSTTWTFGDAGSVPVVANGTAFHQYTVLGTYNASVIIKNAGGCVYTGSQLIAVNGSPTGTWIHDTGYICNNATVNFTVNGNSFTDSVIINYGDVEVRYPYSTTNNSFPHIYLSGGDRNPTVILKSTNGCEFPLNAMGTVRVDYPKAAYLDPIPQDNTPCGYSIVTFKNQSRADQNVANAQYVWKIDGVSYTFKDSVFKFYTVGSHTVQLQINSVSGCTDITAVQTFNVDVHNFPNILNVTRIDSACVNQTIFYTANVSPSQDPITNYIWTFGNGTTYTSTTNTANTVYGVALNNYIDRLIVTTANCRKTFDLPTLVINPTPSVSINLNDLTVCENTPIPLTATANLPCTFDWFPKNAGLSPQTGATVTATPIDTIQYWVNGYTAYGCMDSASINIGVMHQPILTINKGMKDSICLGDIVELKVISTPDNGNHDYKWSPRGINSYIIDTGVNAGLGPIIHVQPKVNITYVVSDKSTACGVITPATIAIAVGDTLHVSFNTDVVHLQSNQKYTLTPFYSDAIKSTIWSPNAYFTAATGYTQPYPEVDVINNVCYSVDATSIYGCKATDTLCIVAFCEASQVFIPNAFTPDGNGTNDYFYITATGISKVTTFRVFNRWGQVVFERANFIPPAYKSAAYNAATAWDGKVNGIVAPTDTYVYTCEVECANGTKFVYTGSVTLIK